jgi:hypothetical protein
MSTQLSDVKASIDQLAAVLVSDEYQEPMNTSSGEIQATLERHANQITDALSDLTAAVDRLAGLAFPAPRPSLLRRLLGFRAV